MKDSLSKMTGKYALILSVLYILSYSFNCIINELDHNDESLSNAIVWSSTPWIFDFSLNILTAVLLRIDIKKFGVYTKYVTLATILYRPVGVFAFLLFCALRETKWELKER